MTHSDSETRVAALRLGMFKELLKLLRALGDLDLPVNDRDGLRRWVDLLLRLAAVAGIDARWIERLGSILEDEDVLQIVLAVLRYVSRLARTQEHKGINPAMVEARTPVEAQTVAEWLEILIAICQLFRQWKGPS